MINTGRKKVYYLKWVRGEGTEENPRLTKWWDGERFNPNPDKAKIYKRKKRAFNIAREMWQQPRVVEYDPITQTEFEYI